MSPDRILGGVSAPSHGGRKHGRSRSKSRSRSRSRSKKY